MGVAMNTSFSIGSKLQLILEKMTPPGLNPPPSLGARFLVQAAPPYNQQATPSHPAIIYLCDMNQNHLYAIHMSTANFSAFHQNLCGLTIEFIGVINNNPSACEFEIV